MKQQPIFGPTSDALSALTPTVFHEAWWLQAVSRGTIQEATVSSGGRVIGRLPYVLTRKTTGHLAVTAPEMTPELGPALLADRVACSDTHAVKRFNLTTELLAQLPRASHTYFELHRHVLDTMAFQSAGFHCRVRFAVEIPVRPPALLWQQMRDKTRNVIRRAKEKLTVEETQDVEEFVWFYDKNIQERTRVNQYKRDVFTALVQQSLARTAGRVLMAVDDGGSPQAAIFTVWDRQTEYYLLSTRTAASPNGAVSLLLWTAIQNAAVAGRLFDFMGFHTAPMMNFFTGFGGNLKPRYMVARSSLDYRIAYSVKSRIKHNTVSARLRRLVQLSGVQAK